MHTTFQQQYIQQIRNRPDFQQFVDTQMTKEEARIVEAHVGPVLVMFYTQDGVLHAHKIGQSRVLQVSKSAKERESVQLATRGLNDPMQDWLVD